MSDASDPSQYNFEVFFIYNKMTYLDWKENYRLERIKRNEIWKDIPDYEGYYQVSNLGNVKSVERIILREDGFIAKYKSKNLSPDLSKHGYHRVVLSKNGKAKNILIHVLVAMAFLNHVPCGYKIVVDHIDNNSLNNNINNLQLVSQRHNVSKEKHRKVFTSSYLGVSFCKQTNKWRADINVKCKLKFLGRFNSELEASNTYQKALQFYDNVIVSK